MAQSKWGSRERAMKTLEKAVRTAVIQGKNWKQELFTFLRQYRATPHSTTGKSPSELLNGRKLKSTLPRVQHDEASPEIRQADATRKEKMKEYADKCRNAKSTDLSVGDKVLIKQPKENKMSTPFKPEPLQITHKKGSMITAQNGERTVTRNSKLRCCLPTYLYILFQVMRKNSRHLTLRHLKQLNQLRQLNHLQLQAINHLQLNQ